MNTIKYNQIKEMIYMATSFIVVYAVKIIGTCAAGIGISSFLEGFHTYDFKFKKKGDKNATDTSKSLRERVKGLH